MIGAHNLKLVPYPSRHSEDNRIHLSLAKPPKTPRSIKRYEQLYPGIGIDKEDFCRVTDRFAFRTNAYYLSLIQPNDASDPIRRIIIPDKKELYDWGSLDASHEHLYIKAPGLEHKYADTALLLVTDVCGGYCRFCFRKRLFMNANTEVTRDIRPGLAYIRNHKELTNVLISGGDPLILSTGRLTRIIRQLRKIDHVKIIRIGSKIPAFNPYRILNDPSLTAMLKEFSLPHKRIYVMTHFNHPRELTPEALASVDRLIKAGVIVANQTPILKGVNDTPAVLAELMKKLSYAGIPPYYIFQGRPAAGNSHFAVPIETAITIFNKARKMVAGLVKRARLVMSHTTGKIEIIGKDRDKTYFRYFRAADPDMTGKLLAFKSNPDAYWLDDYRQE